MTGTVRLRAISWAAYGKPDLAIAADQNNVAAVLLNSLSTSAAATLSGVTIGGSGNQSVEAKFPGNTVYAGSTSNTLSLVPTCKQSVLVKAI